LLFHSSAPKTVLRRVKHRSARARAPRGRDRLIPPGDAERFHHDIDGSRLAIFPDLGHVPQEEDPARTAATVIDFLHLQRGVVGTSTR
jgi:pimeloyl-ACP methyl ester carboxylesterase